MLSSAGGVWSVMCSRCLSQLDGETWPSREAAEAALLVAFWELLPNGNTFCLTCSRERREVQFRPTARGVPRRRR